MAARMTLLHWASWRLHTRSASMWIAVLVASSCHILRRLDCPGVKAVNSSCCLSILGCQELPALAVIHIKYVASTNRRVDLTDDSHHAVRVCSKGSFFGISCLRSYILTFQSRAHLLSCIVMLSYDGINTTSTHSGQVRTWSAPSITVI